MTPSKIDEIWKAVSVDITFSFLLLIFGNSKESFENLLQSKQSYDFFYI